MNHFASNLKFIRKGIGWTQADAAKKISEECDEQVSEQRYQSYEYGTWPDADMMLAICRVYYIDDLRLFMEKPLRKIPLSTKILCVTSLAS